jgi:hypothetical protein
MNRPLQEVNVCFQWTADYSAETFFKPTAYFAFNVVDEVTMEFALVGVADDVRLEGIFVGEDSNQGFLVGAETFHGFADGFGVCVAVPGYVLGRPVA